ncbi:MAG TPA: DUF2007 domain-containing protein [Gemmatimonadales bacterium]|nr:DUF2007 domain-containing protein [Gemmatimonadales bacterium]
MKQVYVAQSRVEADLICNELRNLGIDAVVQGDLMAIPTAPFPTIWVPADEEAAALEACKTLKIGTDPGE